MSNATVAKSYRINIKNLVYAPLTSDTKAACTYGDIKRLAGLKSIQLTPTVATGEDYNDGAKDFNISKITGYELSVESSKIPVDARAELLGHRINADGILIISTNDQPIDVAIGYEIELAENRRELVWLLKGKVQPYAQTVNQSEKDIKVASDSTKFVFVKREFDDNFQAVGDTSISTFTDVKAETFLATVPTSFEA